MFRNVHVPFVNHNSDTAPPNFDMLSGSSGENVVSNPQLLMQVYAQLNEAITGWQQALACYQEHITRHEAQVSALKDQIDTLKDELRMARADAETLRLSGTQYVGFIIEHEFLFMTLLEGFHKHLKCWHELCQQSPHLGLVIPCHTLLRIFLKVLNNPLNDPRSTLKKSSGHMRMPRMILVFVPKPTKVA